MRMHGTLLGVRFAAGDVKMRMQQICYDSSKEEIHKTAAVLPISIFLSLRQVSFRAILVPEHEMFGNLWFRYEEGELGIDNTHWIF